MEDMNVRKKALYFLRGEFTSEQLQEIPIPEIKRMVQQRRRRNAAEARRVKHEAETRSSLTDVDKELYTLLTEQGISCKSRVTRHELLVVPDTVLTCKHGQVIRIVWDLRKLGRPYVGMRVIEEVATTQQGTRLHYYSAGSASRMAPIEDMEQFAAMHSGGHRSIRKVSSGE